MNPRKPSDGETARECPDCGAHFTQNDRFCSMCGTELVPVRKRKLPMSRRLAKALGDRYEVVGELGRGGFAVVYSVRDVDTRQYRAVKVIREEFLVSPEIVGRFQREIKIVEGLDHPNILPVEFSGRKEGLVYYAMPRVRGQSLKELLKREKKLGAERSMAIWRQVAEGLDHAHQRDVIHRDIKPANVMLDEEEGVRILDFGIAKGLAMNDGNLSMTGQVIGTAEYMSPEQAAGERNLDNRTDIYSLGVTTFEMLTGEPPLGGSSMFDVLARRMTETAPDVRDLGCDVPEGFALAIARSLERDREERWQNIEEMLAPFGG